MARAKKITETEIIQKKVEKPTSKIGNLVKFQEDKNRLIKIGFRDVKNKFKILTKDIKVSEYHIMVQYDKDGNEIIGSRINYVGKTYDSIILKKGAYLEEAITKETHVKDFPINTFIDQAIGKFCTWLGDDEFTINPNEITATKAYVLLRDINEKFIESRFEHLLQKDNGGILTGVAKKKKLKQLVEDFQSIRVGNTLITAKNIFNIPNFDESITINDI